MRVGVAGLGRMGTAIAERLKEVGHDLVVWNRSPEKTKPLADAGAEVGEEPGRARDPRRGDRHDPDRRRGDRYASTDGPSGMLAGGIAGKLVIDMSTVQPETEVRLAEEVRAKGAAFVECPVGGTVGPARARQADRRRGRRGGGCRPRPADARAALPARRACRPGRRRRQHEARDQPAAASSSTRRSARPTALPKHLGKDPKPG